MCYTCGCNLPYEDHGDKNNITESHLKKAGHTETIKRAGVKKAKANMMKLLDLQKKKGDMQKPNKDYND